MTNKRKEFIDKYIKEIISTSRDDCNLYHLLEGDCDACELCIGLNCLNPCYTGIFTFQTVVDRADEVYNNSMNEILTYISDTYPETFV